MPAATSADFEACLRLARHDENFPVASRLLPAAWRPHVAAIYAFARGADDLADEPALAAGGEPVSPTPAARLAALERWEAGLDGDPPPGFEFVFRALSRTRAERGLDARWFRDLLEAFRWDAAGRAYERWDELRTYADRSAVPIGRLVLGVAGVRDGACEAPSDDLCVALQYTNFWQDLSRDWPRRRYYLPREAWRDAALSEHALRSRFDGRPLDPAALPPNERDALARVVADAVRRTAELYARSRSLPELAGRDLEAYLKTVWRGGSRVLERVAALGARAFVSRPRLSAADRLTLAARATLTLARSV